MVQLPYQKGLDIKKLSHILDKVNTSYKYYWLWSIIDEVSLGHTIIPMKKLACRMIVKCWYHLKYTTAKFRLKDQLPSIVEYTMTLINVDDETEENEFLKILLKIDDPIFHKKINKLCNYVPYRLLSPFLTLKGIPDHKKNKAIYDLAKDNPRCIYSFMDTHDKIRIHLPWRDYFFYHSTIIKNWIEQQIADYLRINSPSQTVFSGVHNLKGNDANMDIDAFDRQLLQNFAIRTVMFIESTLGSSAYFHQRAKCSFQQVSELENMIAEVCSWDETLSYDSEYNEVFLKKASIVNSYKKTISYAYCMDADNVEFSSYTESHFNEFISKLFHRITYSRGDLLSILQQALEKSEAGSILYKKRGDTYIPYLCISGIHAYEEDVSGVVEELPLKVEIELRVFLRQELFTLLELQDKPIKCKEFLHLFNEKCNESEKFRFFLQCNIKGDAGILFRLLNNRLSSNLKALEDFINSEQQYYFIIGEEVVALQEWKKERRVFDAYVEILQRYFNKGYQVVEVLENAVQILKEEEKNREKRDRSSLE